MEWSNIKKAHKKIGMKITCCTVYQVIQNNWNQAGWYFHKIKDISIKLKYMLSGNVFQFYDQIGSNMEEQGETTDGKRVQKHWRAFPWDRLEHRMTEGPRRKSWKSEYILPN